MLLFSPRILSLTRHIRSIRTTTSYQTFTRSYANMASLAPFGKKHKVTVVGSGNWGSAIAKMVAESTKAHPELFEPQVQMWVFEETITMPTDSKKYDASSELCTTPQPLTKLINHFHENVKYLPGIALPHNLVANPSLTESVKDSTILVFNLPHQFIAGICEQLKGYILPYARGVSCIKGVDVKGSEISLFSESIGAHLGIYCGALSGANIANEVAQEKFSETTIAYDPPPMDSQAPTPVTSAGPSPSGSSTDLTQLVHKDASGKTSKVKLRPLPTEYPPIDHSTLKTLFHRPYFHVRVVSDVAGVSLGGALKNIVALAAGFVDGLGWGDNAKAAIMRVGLLEMVSFGQTFYGNTINIGTFTEESAGVADLITTCSGGRNHRCAKLSVQRGVSIEEVEAKELNGQKLQGTSTAVEVNEFLKSRGLEKQFPLFTAVYNILQGNAKPEDLPRLIEPSSENLPAANQHEHVPKTESREPVPTAANVDATVVTQTNVPELESHDIPTKEKSENSIVPPHPLASSRYTRQLLLPQVSIPGHQNLANARVLIIGLGGLGCPASLYLASAGIGTLGLLDSDTVELSNLHRQVLHREDSVGWTKVKSAIRGLKDINSEIKYHGYEEPFTPDNAVGIAKEYDLILDCTDNPQTRYLISDVAVALGMTVVSAAAQRIDGQCMLLNYPVGKGPCYRCIFPRAPNAEMVVSCEEVGVLGTAVGTMGVVMAGEAIRILVQGQNPANERKPGMLLYSAWSETMFRNVRLKGKRKGCISCGEQIDMKPDEFKITTETIEGGRFDYITFCGSRQDVKLLQRDERISAGQFLDATLSPPPPPTKTQPSEPSTSIVVDVREPHEFILGAQIKDSINIPISTILRTSSSPQPDPAALWSLLPSQLSSTNGEVQSQSSSSSSPLPSSLYFICQRGNDSQIAARKFLDAGNMNGFKWVGDVEGGMEAVLRHVQQG